jgi:chaperonin GroES
MRLSDPPARLFLKEISMHVQPLRDRVLVQRSNPDEKTPGGLIIPDNAKEKPAKGTVMAVGTGMLLPDGSSAALAVKVGDTVFFQKNAGVEVQHDGPVLLLLRESDILCKLEH